VIVLSCSDSDFYHLTAKTDKKQAELSPFYFLLYTNTMLSSIFKLYDIRGKYPSEINEVVVFDIVRNFPALFGKNIRVIIGHDARHSSPSLYKAAIQTLREMNCVVIEAGIITTPMSMFLAHRFKFKKDIAVMITASHNPKNQNGIKIIDEHLNVMGGKELFALVKKISQKNTKKESKKKTTVYKKAAQARKEYIDFLNGFFVATQERKTIKIVIDCSNGSTGPILRGMRFPSWVRPLFLNAKPDGNFPAHSPNPLDEKSLLDVKREIQKQKADLGVVLDGDGDRIVCVDNKGSRVRPEYIWRLIMGHEKYTRTVVTELNAYFVKKLAQSQLPQKIKAYPARVGRMSMLQEMKKRDADFGFENSGHYYFKDFFYSDCGILTLIKILNATRSLPYSLSDFVNMLPHTLRLPEYNIPTRRIDAFPYRALVKSMGANVKNTSFFEGVSVRYDDMYVNVRASNTEPEIRINVEGENIKKVKKLLEKTVRAVRKSIA